MPVKDKYIAYVSIYTMQDKNGIKIYDVDMENGLFTEKAEVKLSNSSYMTITHDKKYLYAITDMGVEAYRIENDGMLTEIDSASINGMRGCYLSTDYTDRYLFVAGYHDGKITVLKLNDDGTVAKITDEIFHKGLGSIAERNFRPHVNCVKMTRDNKYLCAADLGLDHTNVYKLDYKNGKLKLVDVIRSDIESAPRHLKFSKDGKYLYIVHELKNCIDVYHYYEVDDNPEFDKIQTISTLNDYHAGGSAASALNFSDDFQYMISSNAGDNSVIVYKINQDEGTLDKRFCLPISGSYPKDVAIFPDNRHLVSLNHESDTMTFFNLDLEKNVIVMHGKEISIEKPNCVIFHKLNS